MRFANLILFSLLTTALITNLNAKEVAQELKHDLEQSYLWHWFSTDSAEPVNVSLTPIKESNDINRVNMRFVSDDGQLVNGTLARPIVNTGGNKLVLAMHPMGLDQQFWWDEKSKLPGYKLTAKLLEQGYTVITLDARRHGERSNSSFGPRELIKRAHSKEPRLYIDTIIGSVRDYRIILNWAKAEFQPEEVLVMGYSMGAQMSLLLASYESSVDTVLAMVPPYVTSPTSPVAPRMHVGRITKANVLWFAGTKDPYSDKQQTEETFNGIASSNKKLNWFDAGHILPNEFVATAISFFDTLALEGEQ